MTIEPDGPLIEHTSSAEPHYELMALARVLAEGLGLQRDGQDGVSYLQEIRDHMGSGGGGGLGDDSQTVLEAIHAELAQMRAILQAGHETSEAMRQEAQAVLAAHAEAAQNYMGQIETAAPLDPSPFESVPAGTAARDLADGGRLFLLPDGDQVRVNPDGAMAFIGADGMAQPIGPPQGRAIHLPSGLTLTLAPQAMRATHEAAMIEGLPWDVTPTQVAERRYCLALPGDIRLDIDHAQGTVIVATPMATTLALGLARIEGFGEDVETRLLPGGARAFAALESGHRGVIDADGTIHLGLSTGLDLVIRFPAPPAENDAEGQAPGVCGIDCQERGV